MLFWFVRLVSGEVIVGMGSRKQAKENGKIYITVAWIFLILYFIPFVLRAFLI